MRARSAAAATLTIALMWVLAACSDDTSSGAADDPTVTASPGESSPTSDAPSPGDDETCPYLSAEQVAAVLRDPVVQTAGSMHACFFDPPGGGSGPSVMLSRVDVQIDPADYAAQTRALCQGEVTEVEAGDEAFACLMGLGPQGQVYVGKVLVTVNVNGAGDDASGIAVARELLPEVIVPPES